MFSEPEANSRLEATSATDAVVFEGPRRLSLRRLALPVPDPKQVIVEVEWSGISTGTEKLLWTGTMPRFPGMGYPLVPGYETVGRIADVGGEADRRVGERVFVSGARCFGEVRGLFGGAASTLVVDADKTIPLPEALGEEATLLALAATAQHALGTSSAPDLIIGHGVLGRLLARLTVAVFGVEPTVWEIDAERRGGAAGYRVTHPDEDSSTDYGRVIDASGDPGILDKTIARLRKGGEVVLGGFYPEPLQFAFPPAFMREATIRVAAEWTPEDLMSVRELAVNGRLSLEGLISHRAVADDAARAYPIAFSDPACLKMVLDWRH